MQKITCHIKNPSKFSKASKLAVRLIQAGSVKPETSGHFIALLEAAMSSKTPCTDRLVRADFHALFSAAQDVTEVNIIELIVKDIELNYFSMCRGGIYLMNVPIFFSHLVP